MEASGSFRVWPMEIDGHFVPPDEKERFLTRMEYDS